MLLGHEVGSPNMGPPANARPSKVWGSALLAEFLFLSLATLYLFWMFLPSSAFVFFFFWFLPFFLNVDPFPRRDSWVFLGIFLSCISTAASASVAAAATAPTPPHPTCQSSELLYSSNAESSDFLNMTPKSWAWNLSISLRSSEESQSDSSY